MARVSQPAVSALATPTDGTALPARLIEQAKETVFAAWNDFAGKGGILELTAQLEAKVTGISGYLFKVAQSCAKAAKGEPKLMAAMFSSCIADAEANLIGTVTQRGDKEELSKVSEFLDGKTDDEGTKRPSSWSTLKRNISGAMKDGFNPSDYKSESSLRAARKAGKAGNTGQANGSSPQTAAQRAAKLMDTSEAVAPDSGEVQGAVTELLKTIHAISLDEHEDEVMAVLDKAIKSLRHLMPKDEGVAKLVNAPKEAVAA